MKLLIKNELKFSFKEFLISFMLLFGTWFLLAIIIPIAKKLMDIGIKDSTMTFIVTNFILLVVGSVIASGVLLIINIVNSLQTKLFSDEGYFSFSLPFSINKIMLSKYFVNLIWIIIYFLISVVGIGMVFLSLTIFNITSVTFGDLAEIIIEMGNNIVYLPFVIINFLVDFVLGFSVLFFSLSILNIGNIKKSKNLIGIILFLAISYAINIIVSLFNPLSFGFIPSGDGGLDFVSGNIISSSTFIGSIIVNNPYLINFTELILNVGFCLLLYFLTKYLLKNKLEL